MPVVNVDAHTWKEKVADSKDPVLVNFSSSRCGFCMALEPLYKKLSDEYGDRMTFLKLMVDEGQNKEVAQRASVQGTPTLKFYCRGREVGVHVGYAIESVLRKKIDESLQEMESCLQNSTPIK
jgi:thiol-disulfide isomerase/thioredoxin